MVRTLHEHLGAFDKYVEGSLCSGATLDRLQRLPATLPPCRRTTLECHLGTGGSRVDFSCKYLKQDLVDARFPETGAWQDIERFRQEWTDPRSDLSRLVGLVGLEFDVADSFSMASAPAIFFALDTSSSTEAALAARRLAVLFERKEDSPAFGRYLQWLPSGASVNYLGMMLSRPDRPMRVGIEGLAGLANCPQYLLSAGWRGRVDSLSAVLGGMPAMNHASYVLALDWNHRIQARAGVELVLSHREAIDEGRAEALLNHLVTRGLCTGPEGRAIVNWPSPLESKPWLRGFTPAAGEAVARSTSHVKVVVGPDGALTAKCYLEVAVA